MTLEPTDQPRQENAPLVPILPVQDGAPDSVSVSAWHLALSNLVGLDVPHDLLGLWLFPDRGGVVLLAPSELAQDHREIQPPSPFVSQHHLFELEERIRRAGYRSVVAVPVRGGERDLGLVLFAALDAGRYGVVEAVRLHAIVRQLRPDFVSLAAAPPVSAGTAAANDITGVNFNEYTFRVSRTNYQDAVNQCEYMGRPSTRPLSSSRRTMPLAGARPRPIATPAPSTAAPSLPTTSLPRPTPPTLHPTMEQIGNSGAEAWILTWAGGGFVSIMQAARDLGVTDEMALS